MTARRVGDTKYAPLLRHLAALPADQASVTLMLAEVEASIGVALPPGARTPRFWSTGTSVRMQFRRAGWRAALDRQRAVVTCRRSPADAARRQVSDHAAIVAAYQAGDSITAVAQRFARSRTRVYQGSPHETEICVR